MNCRKEWNPDFLYQHFTKTWLTHDYRAMRETILLEEEKTYLPHLQEEAERLKILSEFDDETKMIERKTAENELDVDQSVKSQIERRATLKRELTQVRIKRYKYYEQKPLENKVKPLVIMKCTQLDCRGFLNENMKCGICFTNICKLCHGKKEDTHECIPDEVASVKELEKTTKPCPQCFIRIYKIDGCDQMFCIQCHTAFSWNTGKVEGGVIHNPHYFEALRKGNIREPRHYQQHGGCGPIQEFRVIRSLILEAPLDMQQELTTFYQRVVHFRQVVMPRFIQQHIEEIKHDRVMYLIGRLSEDKFKSKIYIRSQRNKRKEEERQIIESFVTIGEELFRMLKSDTILEIRNQWLELKRITNEAIQQIDKKYQHKGILNHSDII